MSQLKITPLRATGPGPRVLTIDAEDWFHICGHPIYSDPKRWDAFVPRVETTLRGILDALEKGGHRATIFFLGWIARRYPHLVRESARRGHEVGVHGDAHRRADEMTPAELREDLERSREAVERASGTRASAHRAAEWSIRHPGDPALAAVAEAGFRCDASMTSVPPLGRATNPVGPFRIQGDGWSLIEVPPLTGSVLGLRLPLGGAWPFRVLPVSRLASAEKSARLRGEPAVFTVHPWEFDRDHPAMPGLSPLQRTVHFLGRARLPARFARWLALEPCVALEDAVASLSSS